VDAVLEARPDVAGAGDPTRPGVVHRLDLDTSGLVIFARTQEAFEALGRMIRAREVTRTYIALVAGKVEPPAGAIEAPIGRDPGKRTRQAIVSTGKPARTRYRTVRQFDGATLLEVTLETGRMHQIRVHMAATGHPVIGDPVYGGRAPSPVRLDRQFLHAARLSFKHPVTGAAIDLTSPLPEDLREALAQIERS
jgi:23S rRNA pseudouridine1911/1915/1917 synthase